MNLLFVQQIPKHCDGVSESRSVSKHVIFALGVDRTAGDAVKVGVPT